MLYPIVGRQVAITKSNLRYPHMKLCQLCKNGLGNAIDGSWFMATNKKIKIECSGANWFGANGRAQNLCHTTTQRIFHFRRWTTSNCV